MKTPIIVAFVFTVLLAFSFAQAGAANANPLATTSPQVIAAAPSIPPFPPAGENAGANPKIIAALVDPSSDIIAAIVDEPSKECGLDPQTNKCGGSCSNSSQQCLPYYSGDKFLCGCTAKSISVELPQPQVVQKDFLSAFLDPISEFINSIFGITPSDAPSQPPPQEPSVPVELPTRPQLPPPKTILPVEPPTPPQQPEPKTPQAPPAKPPEIFTIATSNADGMSGTIAISLKGVVPAGSLSVGLAGASASHKFVAGQVSDTFAYSCTFTGSSAPYTATYVSADGKLRSTTSGTVNCNGKLIGENPK